MLQSAADSCPKTGCRSNFVCSGSGSSGAKAGEVRLSTCSVPAKSFLRPMLEDEPGSQHQRREFRADVCSAGEVPKLVLTLRRGKLAEVIKVHEDPVTAFEHAVTRVLMPCSCYSPALSYRTTHDILLGRANKEALAHSDHRPLREQVQPGCRYIECFCFDRGALGNQAEGGCIQPPKPSVLRLPLKEAPPSGSSRGTLWSSLP